MNPQSALPGPTSAAALPPWLKRGRVPLAVALALAGVAGVWAGGWSGLLGLGAAVAGVGLLLPRDAAVGPAGPADAARAAVEVPAAGASVATGQRSGTRLGAEVMVSAVVPVWSRQLEVTRDAGSEGLSNIIMAFSEVNGALNGLATNLASFNVTAAPGAVDEAVRSQAPALQILTAASSRAFAERDAAVAELGRCADGLTELQHLAKQTRELSRHTRLVAFNASIESNRQTAGSGPAKAHLGGTQAVAGELRMLSGRIAETAEKIERVVSRLSESVRHARRHGEVADTSTEELRLEIDLRAREALNTLLAGIGASVHSGGEVQQAAAQLSTQLESIFVQFQFGDRVSQMLSIIANDMDHFADWIRTHPKASQADAADWLAALESSYTMEEQRSTHHGNVHIDAGAAVEFF
jgi:methyl-accepting chemotaxis protein